VIAVIGKAKTFETQRNRGSGGDYQIAISAKTAKIAGIGSRTLPLIAGSPDHPILA
jgi:hypothetical protein